MRLTHLITGVVILFALGLYGRYYISRENDSSQYRTKEEETIPNDIEDVMKCDTWNELNKVIGVNHKRLINTTNEVRENPKKLSDISSKRFTNHKQDR